MARRSGIRSRYAQSSSHVLAVSTANGPEPHFCRGRQPSRMYFTVLYTRALHMTITRRGKCMRCAAANTGISSCDSRSTWRWRSTERSAIPEWCLECRSGRVERQTSAPACFVRVRLRTAGDSSSVCASVRRESRRAARRRKRRARECRGESESDVSCFAARSHVCFALTCSAYDGASSLRLRQTYGTHRDETRHDTKRTSSICKS